MRQRAPSARLSTSRFEIEQPLRLQQREPESLWERLDGPVSARGTRMLSWHYVRGHVGIPGNERVDEIADSFATRKPVALYDGPLWACPLPILDLLHLLCHQCGELAKVSEMVLQNLVHLRVIDLPVRVHEEVAKTRERRRDRH